MANRKMLDLANLVEQMQSDIAELKGRVDEVNYGLQMAQKRQQDLYVDLDNRLTSFEAGKSQAQLSTESKILHTASAYIHAGKYDEARVSLQKFIAAHPHSKQLGTAYYWLGMSQAGMKNFTSAQLLLTKVATEFPDDPHAPEALLALASVQASQKDKAASVQTLHALIERYSQSTAAQQAKKALSIR